MMKFNKKILRSALLAIIILISFIAKKDIIQSSPKSYIITSHAQCRMECRKISRDEIDEVLANGKINKRKSNPQSKPCPTMAYEGISSKDKQKIRIITADCENTLKIVTVIDLLTQHDCNCH